MKRQSLYTSVIMAGFGGQGLMFIGKLLAFSAMKRGLNVTWIPSYGPEMRGGTANCTVVVSDEPIGSPIIQSPQSAIIMNNPSLEAFQSRVKEGGLICVNSDLVTVATDRADINYILIPANSEAIEAGESKAANMVMLGAYIGRTGILSRDNIKSGLKELFGSKAAARLESNLAAFDAGVSYGQMPARASTVEPARSVS